MATPEWRAKNRERLRIYGNKWYIANRQKQKDFVSNRKKRLRSWFEEYKKTLKCSRCPEDHPACLDFHHLDSNEKLDCVSNIEGRGWGLKKLMEEINKCVVLCANCHRKLHWKEKWPCGETDITAVF